MHRTGPQLALADAGVGHVETVDSAGLADDGESLRRAHVGRWRCRHVLALTPGQAAVRGPLHRSFKIAVNNHV